MTAWGDAFKAANEALKLYHTIEKSVKDLETNFQLTRADVSSLRLEIMGLSGRVSTLEEGRKTIAAEVNAAMASGLAEIKIAKAETVAQLKVDYANELSKLFQKNLEFQKDLVRQREMEKPDALVPTALPEPDV